MDKSAISSHISRLKESFLYAAARGGRVSECASLLELGASPNWVHHPTTIDSPYNNNTNTNQDDHIHTNTPDLLLSGDTPFLAAVRNGHLDIVSLFLASGADLNIRTNEGDTALHLIAARGDEDLWRLLIQSGYSDSDLCNVKNKKGETATEIAIQKGFDILGDLMKSKEVQPYTHYAQSSSVIAPISVCNHESRLEEISEDEESSFQLTDLDVNYNSNLESEENDEEKSEWEIHQYDSYTEHLRRQGREQNILVIDGYEEDEEDEDENVSSDDELDPDQNPWVPEHHTVHQEPILPSNNSTSFSYSSDDESLHHSIDLQADNDDQQFQREELFSSSSSFTSSSASSTQDIMATREHEHPQMMQTLDKEMNNPHNLDWKKQITSLQKEIQCVVEQHLHHHKSIQQLELLEETLQTSLRFVIEQKEILSRKKIQEEEEKRSCVICQVEEKSVLLMPCRHLCVCKECSKRKELIKCPLCRIHIEDKIHVYA